MVVYSVRCKVAPFIYNFCFCSLMAGLCAAISISRPPAPEWQCRRDGIQLSIDWIITFECIDLFFIVHRCTVLHPVAAQPAVVGFVICECLNFDFNRSHFGNKCGVTCPMIHRTYSYEQLTIKRVITHEKSKTARPTGHT